MTGPASSPPTRLRSRHRLLQPEQVARSQLRGSLIVDALVLTGAAAWWASGNRVVALIWAGAAVVMAAASVVGHRRGSRSGATEERWRLRGIPGPGSIVAILGMAVLVLVTLRFGVGWTWGDALWIPAGTAVSSLFMAWLDARRYRKWVAERRAPRD